MLYDVLVSQGHTVTVITSDYRHFKKTYITEEKKYYKYVHVSAYKKNLSVARLKSHHFFAKDAFKIVEELEPDLLYVLIPANSLCKRAVQYKKKHKDVKFVFDVIDMWPETMPIGKLKAVFPFTVWKSLRDKNINKADFVICECKLFAERLATVVDGSKLETVYFAADGYKGNVGGYASADDTLNLCYLGSINNIIDIDMIKELIISTKRKTVVHVIGDGESKEELCQAITSAGGTVVDYGKLYDEDKKAMIMSKCHFGLNIMKQTVFVGLTMKSVDYMRFGLPIINNIKGDTWELIEKHNLGINVEGNIDWDKTFVRKNIVDFFDRTLSRKCFNLYVTEIITKVMNGNE